MEQNKIQIRLKEENMTIHRYMDYPKFLSLLATNSIYFARPHEFEDKLDCILPNYTKIKQDSSIQKIIKSEFKNLSKNILDTIKMQNSNKGQTIVFRDAIVPHIIKKYTKGDMSFYSRMTTQIDRLANLYLEGKETETLNELTDFLYKEMYNPSTVELNHNRVLVNCWHMGDCESDLMWKIYGKKDGVLILTNAEKLKWLDFDKCLEDDALCIIDKVKYIDDLAKRNEALNNLTLDDIIGKDQDIMHHYFEKEKSFEAEKELRIVIAQSNRYTNDFCEKQKGELIKIKMPICDFIEKIVISPHAPDYYVETLKTTLKNMKQNGIDKLADKIELSKVKQIEKSLL